MGEERKYDVVRVSVLWSFQCFDTDVWVTRRSSGLQNPLQ